MYTPLHIRKKVAIATSPIPTETLDTEVANAIPVHADPYQSATSMHTALITPFSFPSMAAILSPAAGQTPHGSLHVIQMTPTRLSML